MTHRVEEAAVFTGTVTITAGNLSEQPRDMLEQDTVVRFPIPLHEFRVFDALATALSGTPASDDLGLTTGTFASAPLRMSAGDLKAAGATTRRARHPQVIVPECYDAAETFQIIVSCGMETTVADTSCTVDIEVCRLDKDGAVAADICATAAQSMNSLSFSDKTFTITATTLAPGDVLDVRVSITCTDAATGTAVTPAIASIDVACDIKG
jgi:hypothetical protein